MWQLLVNLHKWPITLTILEFLLSDVQILTSQSLQTHLKLLMFYIKCLLVSVRLTRPRESSDTLYVTPNRKNVTHRTIWHPPQRLVKIMVSDSFRILSIKVSMTTSSLPAPPFLSLPPPLVSVPLYSICMRLSGWSSSYRRSMNEPWWPFIPSRRRSISCKRYGPYE